MRKLNIIIISILAISLMVPAISLAQSKDIIIGEDGGEEEHRNDRMAVVVGVNDYLSLKVPDLKYAVADAKKIAGILEGKGVFDVTLYTDDSPNKPVKDNIKQALEDANYFASKGYIKSFVFYFSGHGFQENGKNYLATMDVRPDDLVNSAIDLEEVISLMKDIQKNAKVMVFMDACRNDPTGSKSIGSAFAEEDDARGLGMLFSTAPGDYSWELDEIEGGLYTHFLA